MTNIEKIQSLENKIQENKTELTKLTERLEVSKEEKKNLLAKLKELDISEDDLEDKIVDLDTELSEKINVEADPKLKEYFEKQLLIKELTLSTGMRVNSRKLKHKYQADLNNLKKEVADIDFILKISQDQLDNGVEMRENSKTLTRRERRKTK